MRERIEKILLKIRREVEPHLESMTLVTDGVLDSLDIMNIIVQLEKEFDIEISPDNILIENFESVASIQSLVESCKN